MIDTCRPGYIKRSPFLVRILLRLNHVLEQGPTYLGQKAVSWSKHSKYRLKQRYKRYLVELANLSFAARSELHSHIDDQQAYRLEIQGGIFHMPCW